MKTHRLTAEQVYGTAFRQWKDGETFAVLCTELGINSSTTLVDRFKFLAGGEDQYTALCQAGAGGARAALRATGQASMDDSKVKHVRSSPRWKIEREYEPIAVKIKLPDKSTATMPWRELKLTTYISPKGNRYVQAAPTERADLLVHTSLFPNGQFPLRLRNLQTSAALRKHKHSLKEKAHGLKAHAERKKAKAKKQKHLARLAK